MSEGKGAELRATPGIEKSIRTAKEAMGFRNGDLGIMLVGAGAGMMSAVLFGAGGEFLVGAVLVAAGIAVNKKLVGKVARRLADGSGKAA